MGYIDIHSHILPGIDDGAKTLEESIALLEQEKENGVTSVVCTPHFYPKADTLESHLEKCSNAFALLKESVKFKELPQLYLGHEVQYFTGISKCQSLDKLCFSGTNILLLELPFLTPLSDKMLHEVMHIDRDLGITVILAHIERYSSDKCFRKLLKLIKNGDVSAQVNADSITNPKMQKTVLKLIKKGLISYIASDAHSLASRPVLIGKAFKELRGKFYAQSVTFMKNSERLERTMEGAENG